VQAAVGVMGGKWKPGILFRLKNGRFRFGKLKQEMPWISEKVLIRQLKELVSSEVVARHDFAEVPARVEYVLTPYGKTLLPPLRSMAKWGQLHLQYENTTPAAKDTP
jgi:DNA-binding HxlR family transcriptional regulator